MPSPTVRTLTPDDVAPAVRIVAHGMLGSLADDVVDAWAALVPPDECHGAISADGEVVGVARWFRDELSVPGGSLPAAGVTAVAVLPNHRRQGHLRRLMEAQLADIHRAGVPVATLVAAEWPIYGRYGYGPAVEACGYEVDAARARFREPPSGRIELVSAAELRPHLEAVHAAKWARSPGSLRRAPQVWDRLAGLQRWPGDTSDPGLERRALWRDGSGEVQGAVVYRVSDRWDRNRPSGTAETNRLFGATPEAERELWRHLCELDWVTTVNGGLRGVDDPLPLFLLDGRAAAPVDRSDAIWLRLLDLPAALAARRSTHHGALVVQVDDDLGYTAGRWRLEVGPDGGSATATDDPAAVRLGTGALAAAYLGGRSPRRLAEAGLAEELRPGAVDELAAMLATPAAPHSTTSY